jgi:hypothetical protein
MAQPEHLKQDENPAAGLIGLGRYIVDGGNLEDR